MEYFIAFLAFIAINLLATLFLRAELHYEIEFLISRGLQRLKCIFDKKFFRRKF